ncbi:hypothetical protein JCM10449v2_002800 [Rhodotorula kratochvilovae]
MPSLASLLPLALLPAAAFAAPLSPAQSGVIRLAARTPSTDGLTQEQLLARVDDSLARLVRASQATADAPVGSLKKRRVTVNVPITKHYTADKQADTHAGNIVIGGQNLPVLFDTGSTDLVIPVDCKSGCKNGSLKTAQSSTFKNNTEAVSVTYGTGSAEGYLAEETVSIGGLTLPGQAFVAATSMQTGNSENWAGIMGLSAGYGQATGEASFMQRLITSGVLAANQFAFSLGTEIYGKPREAASLVFGGVDTTNIKEPFVQVPNIGDGAGIVRCSLGALRPPLTSATRAAVARSD